jgi:hypothetical protein
MFASCHNTSGVGGRSTIGDVRINESMKRESRLGRAASGKRANAILGRRHVPAVPKSRDLAGAAHGPDVCHARTLAARRAGRKPFILWLCVARHSDDERPEEANKLLFGGTMLDQFDHRVRPGLRVIDGEIVSIDTQKMPQSLKSSALIALFERMCPSDPGHQDDAKHEDVFLAEAKKVAGSRHRAFEQTAIAQKVRFAGGLRLKAIVLDYDIGREPARLIRQGRLES